MSERDEIARKVGQVIYELGEKRGLATAYFIDAKVAGLYDQANWKLMVAIDVTTAELAWQEFNTWEEIAGNTGY